MSVSFLIMILIGVVLAWNRSGDVWLVSVLAGWRGIGVLLIVAGIIGELFT